MVIYLSERALNYMKQDCSDRSDRKHYRETLVVLSLPFNTKH